MFSLVRASYQNGVFSELEAQWLAQSAELNPGEEPGDFMPTMMDHARKIAAEEPQDRKYGIYALVNPQAPGERSYEGLIHVNHKLPNTTAATVRMVWNLLAPRYDYDQPDQIAAIMASYLIGGIKLCRSDMRAGALQMYLHNGTDRRYAVGAVGVLREIHAELSIDVRGSWLHIENINAKPTTGITL